jgi:hypothetical protein
MMIANLWDLGIHHRLCSPEGQAVKQESEVRGTCRCVYVCASEFLCLAPYLPWTPIQPVAAGKPVFAVTSATWPSGTGSAACSIFARKAIFSWTTSLTSGSNWTKTA